MVGRVLPGVSQVLEKINEAENRTLIEWRIGDSFVAFAASRTVVY